MVEFTGTYQGTFTATGNDQVLQLRSDVDWMWVKNLTTSYAVGADTGVEFYWQRGMTQGRGTLYTKTVAAATLEIAQIAANSGFYLIDSSVNTPGASVAVTGIDNGTPPTVFTGSTANLTNGNIVRIFNTVGAQQLGGMDFTINNVVANTSFDLAYMAAIVNANPGAGSYRRIPFDPLYYPTHRYITKITQAATAVVSLSVTHGYTVGQKIRFVIPSVTATRFGMTELDGVEATIIATGDADVDGFTNTITVNVDTSGFTAFTFPLTADAAIGFTPAQIVPVGENTAQALTSSVDLLGDSERNIGYIGMLLKAGTSSPAGAVGDSIYWVAGKSFGS